MFRRPMFCVLLVALVSSCLCQEEEDDGGSSEGGSVWGRLKKAVKNFVESMRGLMREMKDEIKARTSEIGEWTKEMFDSFKGKMKEWVNEAKASDYEKEDMKNYIERLEMPKQDKDN